MLMLLLGAVAIALAIYLVSRGRHRAPGQLALSLRRAKRYGGYAARGRARQGHGRPRAVAGDRPPGRLALRLPGAVSPDELRRRLIAAGLAGRVSPTTFLAGKSAFAIGSIGFGFLLLLGGNAMGLLLGRAAPGPGSCCRTRS